MRKKIPLDKNIEPSLKSSDFYKVFYIVNGS